MSKIGLIISQEYRNRVAKKSFLLLTFLMPLLFVGIILVPVWLASIDSKEQRVIAVVDHTGLYGDFLDSISTDGLKFDVMGFVAPEKVDSIRNAENSGYNGVMIISKNLGETPDAIAIYSEKQVPVEVSNFVESELSSYIERQKLLAYNIEDIEQKIADAKTEVKVSTYKWNADGTEGNSNADVAMIVGMLATMLIYMFIFISGSQVMSAVVQEKVNRVVEVMVCSVKPWELMWGKIISVALVCLTQMAMWVVLTLGMVYLVAPLMGVDMAAMQQTPDMMAAGQPQPSDVAEIVSAVATVNWIYIIAMFVIYFICGYLLYASMFAAIGAAVDNEADTGQFMMPITFVVLFAFYAGIYGAQNPDGPLALWSSMIPFTSPIVMMVRIPFDVPLWQIGVSLGLLVATIVFTVWISAKIYRVGILMYGKKSSWKELIKWIKY